MNTTDKTIHNECDDPRVKEECRIITPRPNNIIIIISMYAVGIVKYVRLLC
jgi:hypothetical protein